MIKPVPTLDTVGWVTDPNIMLPRILLYYVKSNPHQTLVYFNYVVSMQSAMAHSGDSEFELTNRIDKDLNMVFNHYFPDSANITVDVKTYDESKINIEISVTVKVGGKTYTLLNALRSTDNRYRQVVEYIDVVSL